MDRPKLSLLVILTMMVLAGGQVAIAVDLPVEDKGSTIQSLEDDQFQNVMGRTMREKLDNTDDAEEMEVIIQFHESPGERETRILDHLEIENLYTYKVLPAIRARASVGALRQLTGYPGLKYMEPDRVIVQDMELSTSVINASKTWSREILDLTRNDMPIDGTGVTAVVVDTGIDAGHPDLDYGEKTIFNKFVDSENGNIWVEQENTDLYYGHGTHVAGTVAGNGDASAGSRRGVAPGANLIGVTIYNPTAGDYLIALEWVYDHSKPNNNPHNIRVATNSWHTIETEYDPNGALEQIIMHLAYDNNVVSTWSAGNEGRTDPEGTTITTSKEGNTPVAIMVAAYERDGSAVTDFSSRGQVGMNHTYPDIGAPGRTIWSTSARRTVISSGTYFGGNTNPYYLAISGTSMSTPHVAGLVALLWQACPSMKVSDRHEDYSGPDEGWWTDPNTRIHEAEWIMEISATYLPPSDATGVNSQDNSTGMDGKPIDYAQGYGIVDVEKAVGIALTLERLRDMYPEKEITVDDAVKSYEDTMYSTEAEGTTNILYAEWSGEYSRYNDQFGKPISAVNQTKHVYVPETAERAIIDMQYNAISIQDLTFGDITFTIDYDMDGSDDYTGTLAPTMGRIKHEEMSIQGGTAGQLWSFDVIGEGFRVLKPLQDRNYVELRIEYDMSVQFVLSGQGGGNSSGGENESATLVPYNQYPSIGAPLLYGKPTSEYTGGTVVMPRNYYDLTNVELYEEEEIEPVKPERSTPWWILIVILIVVSIMILVYVRKKKLR